MTADQFREIGAQIEQKRVELQKQRYVYIGFDLCSVAISISAYFVGD